MINSAVWITVVVVALYSVSGTIILIPVKPIRKFTVLKTHKWKVICWIKLLLLMTIIFRIDLCLYHKYNTIEKSLNFFPKLCGKCHIDKLSWEVWLKSVFSTISLDIYSVETWWGRKDYSFGILFNTAWSPSSEKELWCFLV